MINGRVIGQETGERYYTFMKAKDNCMYIRAASIARKYNVASATIVRTKADSLSALLLRYAHQTMTRNADTSRCPPRSAILGIWCQQLERVQLRTIRGANRIRNRPKVGVYNRCRSAKVEGVDRDLGEVHVHRGID